jgi:hypothetical protein
VAAADNVANRSAIAALGKVAFRSAKAAFTGGLKRIAAATTILLWPAEALAHGTPLDRPVRWDDWNWDPVILLNLLVISWLYGRGWRMLQQRAAHRQERQPSAGSRTASAAAITTPWRAIAFDLAILIMLAVLVTTLDPMAEKL